MTKAEIEIAKRARNEYARAWRAKNKKRVQETNRRYWLKRAQAAKVGNMTEDGNNEH